MRFDRWAYRHSRNDRLRDCHCFRTLKRWFIKQFSSGRTCLPFPFPFSVLISSPFRSTLLTLSLESFCIGNWFWNWRLWLLLRPCKPEVDREFGDIILHYLHMMFVPELAVNKALTVAATPSLNSLSLSRSFNRVSGLIVAVFRGCLSFCTARRDERIKNSVFSIHLITVFVHSHLNTFF